MTTDSDPSKAASRVAGSYFFLQILPMHDTFQTTCFMTSSLTIRLDPKQRRELHRIAPTAVSSRGGRTFAA
jgi:hypothetical protein